MRLTLAVLKGSSRSVDAREQWGYVAKEANARLSATVSAKSPFLTGTNSDEHLYSLGIFIRAVTFEATKIVHRFSGLDGVDDSSSRNVAGLSSLSSGANRTRDLGLQIANSRDLVSKWSRKVVLRFRNRFLNHSCFARLTLESV